MEIDNSEIRTKLLFQSYVRLFWKFAAKTFRRRHYCNLRMSPLSFSFSFHTFLSEGGIFHQTPEATSR